MATNRIRGLTVEIGGDTTKLGKALADVDKQSRSLSSELGSINKLLKMDPTNTELLAQKQRVLADAISNTEKRLKTLREAEKQVQAQFERGEISEEQYRELQREIIETEQKLNGYRKAAKETADAIDQLGDKTEDAAKSIDDEAGAADDAGNATDDMGGTLKDVAKNGFKALAAAAAAAVTSLVAVAEASREYRTAMGKLDTAFKDNNHSAEAATKTYEELQGILGDSDQAVEAANHLAALCDNEAELAEWTTIATGVYAKFGDSLPIENLTEASNETAKTGKITGGLADALNWAGESEEKFQEALDKCTNEQERQELITKTLTKTYKNAADQYRVTNKEVIRSNEATEKWNKALAKVGGYVEPVVTDIKELGASLLEDASKPLKGLADFIRQKVIPTIKTVSDWCRQNKPIVIGLLTGAAAALVTYKVAALKAELATKGMTIATAAQTVAQKALNVVLNANPWNLLATAIAAVTVGMMGYLAAAQQAKIDTTVLTEAERDLIDNSREAAAAFRDQQAATQESSNGIMSQMGHIQNLATELQSLADASGRVKEEDQARAQFILNEMNNALGTEYQMTGGVIQKYGELKNGIQDVINAKTANALLEAHNADYIAAIQAEADAWNALDATERDYLAKKEEYTANKEELLQWEAEIERRKRLGYYETGLYSYETDQDILAGKRLALDAEEEILDEKKAAYDQAAADYAGYANTISTYEEAQTAALSGNTDLALDLLTEKSTAYSNYSDHVDIETAKALDALKQEAVDAGIEAQRIKRNFEDGVDGYTQEMVDEAEAGYEDAMDAFATAYADAEGVGGDIGDGLGAGLDNKSGSLYSKARNLVSGMIRSMRTEADSHSPARKTIDFGEDMGEGAEIGIDNKTKDVKKAATRQASAILDAYSEQEVNGQQALRNVADRQAAAQTAAQTAATAGNADMLNRILKAIQEGQTLVLDGTTLVGATAGKMDSTLGQRRVLVERGAL